MNYYIHPAGSTSETMIIELRLNNGNPHTGLLYNTNGFTAYYCRPGSAPVAIPLANQTVTGAYVSGGFKELDATYMPGLYRFDIPNAALASGVDYVIVTFHGYGASATSSILIQLSGYESEKIYTNPFKLISDQEGADGNLDVLKSTVLDVNLQLVDDDLSPVAIGSDTCSVKVYDSTNTLVTTYTPTVQYAANGEISFGLTTTVTNNTGNYNVYVTKTGVASTIQFGPLPLKVKAL